MTSIATTSTTYPVTTRSYKMKKDRRWYGRKGIGKLLTVRERKTNFDNLQLNKVLSVGLPLIFSCEACSNFYCLDYGSHHLPIVSPNRANEARTHKTHLKRNTSAAVRAMHAMCYISWLERIASLSIHTTVVSPFNWRVLVLAVKRRCVKPLSVEKAWNVKEYRRISWKANSYTIWASFLQARRYVPFFFGIPVKHASTSCPYSTARDSDSAECLHRPSKL